MGAAGQELLFPLLGNVCPDCSGMLRSGHLTVGSWVNAVVAIADFIFFFVQYEYDHALWLFKV